MTVSAHLAALAVAAAGAASLLLFVYPYLLYPAILARLRVRPTRHAAGHTDGSRFALLFCAYNEMPTARSKVNNLLELKSRYPALEVLVFDDGSSDGCGDIYRSVPGLIEVIRGPGRSGKAHGMKILAAATAREVLVFTDANVILAPDVFDALDGRFADDDVGGVCGHLEYEFQERSATEVVGSGYWTIEENLKVLESRTGNVMGGDGSIFAVRRSLYPDYPDTVQDDFTVTMSVVFRKCRLIFAPDVVAHERLVSSRSDEYRRKVRIAARAFHTYLSMRGSVRGMSRLDRWKFASHKRLRWYGAPFLFGGTLALVVALFIASPVALMVCTATLIIAGALGLWLVPRSRGALEIVIAVIATFHGVCLARFGRTFAVWTPPATR